jgi:hypothetical protein
MENSFVGRPLPTVQRSLEKGRRAPDSRRARATVGQKRDAAARSGLPLASPASFHNHHLVIHWSHSK